MSELPEVLRETREEKIKRHAVLYLRVAEWMTIPEYLKIVESSRCDNEAASWAALEAGIAGAIDRRVEQRKRFRDEAVVAFRKVVRR